ncbi:MAG: glutamate--tRNA ligase [Candidatus Auribacter fodinae]|jgi:glutamyl-tRNA synthetase|uniref:Glutamate--tRNA ligase n=1 Tax=Candidatus Auribacter fodinae TaxID=2093366 RepID=A0A3A4QQC8_9BACT|nr:MAG: glutamate--tRNA ligase [Candidatus Auribacter fodinae]
MVAIRTRFELNPAGVMHVGNARVALYNCLFARKMDGDFIVRVADVDPENNKIESLEEVLNDLRWLKLTWNEGPNIGGKYGPYRQSQRSKIYLEHVKILADKNLAYQCFCSVEELAVRRDQSMRNGKQPGYDSRCRNLTEEQRHMYEKQGRRSVWRFKNGSEAITVHDLIQGDLKFDASLIDDFVILQADNKPTSIFASTVDDALMYISHVIRGADHLSELPCNILLLNAFGYAVPQYAHLGLIQGKNSQNLTKQELNSLFSISALHQKGYLPECVINYLMHLDISAEEDKEIMALEQIADEFDLAQAGSSAVAFEYDKLNWYSAHYLQSSDLTRITDLSLPYLKEKELVAGNLTESEYEYLNNVIDVIRYKVPCLSEMASYAAVYYSDFVGLSDAMKKGVAAPEAQQILRQALALLENSGTELQRQNIPAFLNALKVSAETLQVDLESTLRVVLTGHKQGPDLADVCWLLGKEKIIKRIKDIVEPDV